MGLGLGRGAVGREAVVDEQHDLVGHHVAGHAALDADRLQRLAVLAAVDHRAALLVAVEVAEQPADPVDGVAAHPRAGGVGPGPPQHDPHAHGALAAGLDDAVGGLAEQGDVALQQVGPFLEEPLQAVEPGVDLLGLVEHLGHVDRGLRHGCGQRQHHREAGLHVRRPQPHSTSPSWREGRLPLTGTVSVWPATTRRWSRPSVVRATRLQPMRSSASHGALPGELGLEQVGELLLGVALRADVDQPGGQRQQVDRRPLARRRRRRAPARRAGRAVTAHARHRPPRRHRAAAATRLPPPHRVAPWSRSTSLSELLSWRSALVEVLDEQHARQPELVTAGERAGPGGGDRDGPRWHHTPPDLLAAPGLDHRDRPGEDAPGAEHDAVAHPGAVGDDAPAADQALVAHHDRRRTGRLEHAADADAAREVDVPADLGAASPPWPRCRPWCWRRRGRRC